MQACCSNASSEEQQPGPQSPRACDPVRRPAGLALGRQRQAHCTINSTADKTNWHSISATSSPASGLCSAHTYTVQVPISQLLLCVSLSYTHTHTQTHAGSTYHSSCCVTHTRVCRSPISQLLLFHTHTHVRAGPPSHSSCCVTHTHTHEQLPHLTALAVSHIHTHTQTHTHTHTCRSPITQLLLCHTHCSHSDFITKLESGPHQVSTASP